MCTPRDQGWWAGTSNSRTDPLVTLPLVTLPLNPSPENPVPYHQIQFPAINTRRITELRNLTGDRYAIFTGVDDLFLESAILGIDGWVAGSGIAFPKENQQLWELTRAGKWDEARALYRWSQPS
jgi:hypothetical protein